MSVADAWILRSGFVTGPVEHAADALERGSFTFRELQPGEAVVEPLLGAWEANIDHAIARQPIDVCSTRDEDEILLGNLGLARIRQIHPDSPKSSLQEGDICMLMPFGVTDRNGYAELVYAYDCPGTTGLLAKTTQVPIQLLLPVPEKSKFSLRQWATYGRLFTAWDNWHKAFSAWRLQVPDADPADNLVFAWGGGVSLAFLVLAKNAGFQVAMTAGSDERLELLGRYGITPIDRRELPCLNVPKRSHKDREYSQQHGLSRRKFIDEIQELSSGFGASIIMDNIGEPVYPLTLEALAREGVLTTCGWKAGMRMSHLRGQECIQRHVHLHTHVWHQPSSAATRDAIEAGDWMPPESSITVTGFDDINDMARQSLDHGLPAYYSLYQVNEL